MGYKITYGPAREKRKAQPVRIRPVHIWLGIMILAVFVRLIGYGDDIMKLILPGDPAVTAAALENITQELTAGESISDAFSEFCQEIVDHAQIY